MANAERLAIVTDSPCVSPLLKDQLAPHTPRIFMTDAPITDDHGRQWLTGDLTHEQVIDMLLQGDVLHTAAPAPGEIAQVYMEALHAGYDRIFHVAIGRELSTGYGNATILAMQSEGVAGHVTLFDSQTVYLGTGLLAKRAFEMAQEGKGVEAILDEVEAYRKRIKVFAYLEKPEFAVRGGRIGNLVGRFAGALNLKGILEMDDNQKQAIGVARTRLKGLDTLQDAMLSGSGSSKIERVIFTHTTCGTNPPDVLSTIDAETDIARMSGVVKKAHPNASIEQSEISPVLGVHLGMGAIGAVVVYER